MSTKKKKNNSKKNNIIDWENFETGILEKDERNLMSKVDISLDNSEIVSNALQSPEKYCKIFCKILGECYNLSVLYNITSLIDILFSSSKIFLSKFSCQKRPYDGLLSLFEKSTESSLTIVTFSLINKAFEYEISLENDGQRNSEIEFIKERELVIEKIFDIITNNIKKYSEKSGYDDLVRSNLDTLAILMRKNSCRYQFYKSQGIQPLFELFHAYRNNVQILYEIILCIWLLSFHEKNYIFFHNINIVPILHDILKYYKKEKLIRIVVMTYNNLINLKGLGLSNTTNESIQQMVLDGMEKTKPIISALVSVGVIKTLVSLKKRKYEDPDILQSINVLYGILEIHIEEISSFDEYRQEVLSGHLEWSPPHKSEKFWKSNIEKFIENDYNILKELIKIIKKGVKYMNQLDEEESNNTPGNPQITPGGEGETPGNYDSSDEFEIENDAQQQNENKSLLHIQNSNTPKTPKTPNTPKTPTIENNGNKKIDKMLLKNIMIAIHDIGQFIRFYPRSKKVIKDLEAKPSIIALMDFPNNEIRRQALMCTQKLMINNWKFLK